LRAGQSFNTVAGPTFFAFDVLFVNGEDLRALPLIERKARLKKLLRRKRSRVLYVDHLEGAWPRRSSTSRKLKQKR
jgi:bifunctional non-homologous end joining protein LigD